MKLTTLCFAGCLNVSGTAAIPHHPESTRDLKILETSEAPQTLQPYVLRKGAGKAVNIGGQIYRFSVTGNSSAGAFTLLQTNALAVGELGVLPHLHKAHYENFYCSKGSFQLWAETNSTSEQARLLTQGDYGAVPPETIHTFEITDPDTQMTGIIQPGGFEALFVALSEGDYNSSTGAPFPPSNATATFSGSDPSVIAGLEIFDVYAHFEFNPRRDLINGSAGGPEGWHSQPNTLAPDAVTPNFIAKNRGPKYLNTDDGVYRVIAPLATSEQTEGNFTMGTMTMSPLLANQTASATTSAQPLAFQLEEGALLISVPGYKPTLLIQGDVVFIPAQVTFTYYAVATFTRFLYVSGGVGGFDEVLLQKSAPWYFATYPTYVGYQI